MATRALDDQAAAAREPAAAYRWYVVGVLSLAYCFSAIDARVLTLMVEPIQKDLGLGDFEISLLQGFVVLGIVLAVYLSAMAQGYTEDEVRTMTFTTIVVANLFLILTNRSWTDTFLTTLRAPNRAMWYVFAGTVACLLLVLSVPVLQSLFGFGPVPLKDLLVCAVAGAAGILWFEGYKYWDSGKHR